ncbi:MAG: 16S rRNA (cytidine(1402)-2'-O)-methyltransferase [Bacilli bacterium]|nr:16S rRNA (cytidine(1402)-2'-O)-methyltransferase [Bacilli bacterium]
MIQNSYDGKPNLYLIPTPIGNLEDMTFRAINTLKKVDVVFSEDTRVTGELLKHFEIKKKIIASHKFNECKRKELVLDYLKKGVDVGLVTDRGTPVISDPGYEIASYIISQGFNVVGLPGATALIPALITSGITPMPFTFYGFLNSKENLRKKELENLKSVKWALIFYEAPHRLMSTLGNMLEVLGDRKISISREITKKYEQIIRDDISKVIDAEFELKGEFVIVAEGNNMDVDYSSLDVKEHISFYLNQGMDLKSSMKQVAKDRKKSKSEIYKEYHE